MSRRWLITGCDTGFGRALAEELCRRGEKVAVTGLRQEGVADIAAIAPDNAIALALDVRDRNAIDASLAATVEAFGGIDVLVNNAGYGMQGPLEDSDPAAIRAIFETNFFGLLAMTRAVIPMMRHAGGGRIINFSSIGGRFSAPMLSVYSATKYAVEGLCAGLVEELAPFGIRVTAVEPGAFATNFGTSSLARVKPGPAYAEAVGAMDRALQEITPEAPDGAARAIIALADMKDPPAQLPLGASAHAMISDTVRAQARALEDCAELSRHASQPVR